MTRAIVIGGGIGGPTAAMALQRAGITATVFEAYDAPSDYTGLFLNTASNGLDALQAIDVDLSGVTYIDSRGIRLLVQVARGLRERGGRFTVVAPKETVAGGVLRLTHVAEFELD